MPEPSGWSEEPLLASINQASTPQRLVDLFGIAGIDLRVAKQITAARDVQPQRRFATIAALSSAPGVGVDVAARLMQAAGKLAWTDRPVLLMPVRIETRFIGTELLVRVYPDRMFLDTHESRLTSTEWAAGQAYWEARADGPSAWRELARRVGPPRAAWIVRVVSHLAPGAVPTLRPDSEGWFTPPRFSWLPDRFVVSLYREDQNRIEQVVRTVAGASIKGPLSAMGDPRQGATALFEGDAKWLADFVTAETRGMAIRVGALTAEDLATGFSRVVVVGLRSGGADAGSKTLEALIDAHHYSDGFGFVPYGTPTNNTRLEESGHSESTEDREGSYEVEILGKGKGGPPGEDPWTNAQRLGHAVGLGTKPTALSFVEHAGDQDDAYVQDMQTALWPATGDYLVRHLLPGATSAANLDRAAKHFSQFVRGAGPLPAIRVADQPYGILPAACVRRWKASVADNAGAADAVAFDTALHAALVRLHALWRSWALNPTRVPKIGTTTDPDKELLQILAMQPVAISYQARPFVDERFVGWLLIVMRDYVFGPDTPYAQLNNSPLRWVQRWADEWGKVRAAQAARWKAWTGVPAEVLANSPLLRLTGWWRARDLETELKVPVASQRLNVFGNDPTMMDATLLNDLLERSMALAARNSPAAAAAVKAAIATLMKGAASGVSIDRLFREALDLCHNRLDAWITSLATKRLHAMRQTRAAGIHLGAFGYVEKLKPDKVRGSAGFVHAPSSGQAAAAAVLHNAYLTHADGGAANPFRINLNSARVRQGLRLLEGIRQGQPLAVLLGYQFERQLHECQCDRFIDDFRKAFPLVANKETTAAPEDTVADMAARNVVDGLALARWWQNPERADIAPGDATARGTVRAIEAESGEDYEAVRKEVDRVVSSLDAVSDVLLYEGVFHVVNGNIERGSAAVEAASGQAHPPEIESLITPVSGKALNHRVCMLLRPANNGDAQGPRGRIDPRVAAWAVDLFGDIKNIGCRYAFLDDDGMQPRLDVNAATVAQLQALPGIDASLAGDIAAYRTAHGPYRWLAALVGISGLAAATVNGLRPFATTGVDALSLDELGIDAADLLALAGTPPSGGATEIESRIHYFVRREYGLPHDARVTIDGTRAPGFTYGLEEAMEFGGQALSTLRTGTPLRPDSLCHPSQAIDETYTTEDVNELDGRITPTLQGLCTLIVKLGGAPVQDKHGAPLCQPSTAATDGDALDDALREAGRYGLPDAIPGGPGDPATGQRRKDTLTELERRVAAAQDLLEKSEVLSVEEQIKARLDATAILFGNSAVVLPTIALSDAAQASVSDAITRPKLRDLDQHRIRLWLQQLAMVRKPLAQLDDVFVMADAWRQPTERATTPAMGLRVAQLPSTSTTQWLALDDAERGEQVHQDIDAARGLVSIVIATNDGNAPLTGAIAGVLLDQWDETIPTNKVDTSIAFQYDAPSTQAPQALLLAVPGTRDVGALWDEGELTEIVRDTMDLAKVRAVDADAMGGREKDPPDAPGVGAVLPALMLPADATRPGWARTAFADSIDDWVAAVEETKPLCLHGTLAYPKFTTTEGVTWTICSHPDYPLDRYARGISSSILAASKEIEVRGDAGDISKRIYVKDYQVRDYPVVATVPQQPATLTVEGVANVVGTGTSNNLRLIASTNAVYDLQGGPASEIQALPSGSRVSVTGHVYKGSPFGVLWVDSYTIKSIAGAPPTAIGEFSVGFEGWYLRDEYGKFWFVYTAASASSAFQPNPWSHSGSKIWVFGTKTHATGSTNAPSNPSGQPSIKNVSRYGVLRPAGATVKC